MRRDTRREQLDVRVRHLLDDLEEIERCLRNLLAERAGILEDDEA
jgi:hypothetical protein